MSQTRTLYKSGNSTVLAIPAYLLDHMNWNSGDIIRVEIGDGRSLKLLRHKRLVRDMRGNMPQARPRGGH